jgi:two-component system, NtrC family, sensor kinase
MAGDEHRDYRATFRAMVGGMVLVSLLPLLVIGGANFLLFYRLNRSIVAEQHANFLRYHRQSIETFLKSITAEVSSVAHQYTLGELAAGNLERVFEIIQQPAGMLTDAGVIDQDGNHVRYVGPYDLAGKNYRDAEWFPQVVERGVYVSDMFLGKREVPHFVIAVKRVEGDRFWILRVTVDTDYFSKLVDAVHMGSSGESFIVNSQGIYQTRSRFGGRILAPSGFPLPETRAEAIDMRELDTGGKRYLCTATWLSQPRWLLVVRQETSDAYLPLRRASLVGIALFALGAVGATALAVVLARRQVRMLVQVDREKEQMTQRLLVAGKTAAVGELSAGVAHEINNPLAIIDTLGTWIHDLGSTAPISEDDRAEILQSTSKIAAQVARCKTITQGLLHFSRRVESQPEQLDVNQILEELVTVARSRARVEGMQIVTDLAPLPPITASASDLQQVFVNLVNNAIDALDGQPSGTVTLRSRFADGSIYVDVEDDGCGIAPENLSRIFLPFYTTKPVGRGTGLGLAICYGLVQKLGGTIHVESAVGRGTAFRMKLPVGAADAPAARAS